MAKEVRQGLSDDYKEEKYILSKPQLNNNSTQPNITLSWVRHENDFAHHHRPPPPQKLNVSNITNLT